MVYISDALSPVSKSSRFPVFSPDKKTLVYLQNESGGPHMQCSALVMVSNNLHLSFFVLVHASSLLQLDKSWIVIAHSCHSVGIVHY